MHKGLYYINDSDNLIMRMKEESKRPWSYYSKSFKHLLDYTKSYPSRSHIEGYRSTTIVIPEEML